MDDFDRAREMMVEGQVRVADVTDRRLISAMRDIPREAFVPGKRKVLAYMDEDLPVRDAEAGAVARYLMAPAPFAKLVQLGGVGEADVALVIGCATGYSAAVLARLAGSVVALESDSALAASASETLAKLGIDNVAVVTGPLEQGCPDEAPFDVILVDGAIEAVPDALLAQLKDGGRLVAVIGTGLAAAATLFEKDGGEVGSRSAFNASVMPLPGFERPRAFVF